MIKLIYCPEGIAVSDFAALDFAEAIARDCQNWSVERNVLISSNIVLDAVRALIAEGRCDKDRVVFQLSQTAIPQKADQNGRLSNWTGFPDISCDILARIIRKTSQNNFPNKIKTLQDFS